MLHKKYYVQKFTYTNLISFVALQLCMVVWCPGPSISTKTVVPNLESVNPWGLQVWCKGFMMCRVNKLCSDISKGLTGFADILISTIVDES